MSKDIFFFTHDANASQDPKIIKMCSVYKAEGYGWYWMLVEIMRSQENYAVDLSGKYTLDAFALRSHCEGNAATERWHHWLDDCINEFHLFKREGDLIWSESLRRRMEIRDEIREEARKAAQIRWSRSKTCVRNANALPPHSERNANPMLREGKISKEKKDKISKDIVTPLDFLSHFSEKELVELKTRFPGVDFSWQAEKAKAYWETRELKRPKAAFLNWLERAARDNPPTPLREVKGGQHGRTEQGNRGNGATGGQALNQTEGGGASPFASYGIASDQIGRVEA